jgi:dTDP-4-amino-4,6-dideoxygalactose transaminase
LDIPFNKPYVPPIAKRYLESVLDSSHHSGDGKYSKKAEEKLSRLTDSKRQMLTPSCSHALEISMLALGLGPDDEVIVPSFTFTSCANAIVLSGATPVFVDVSLSNFCLDPDKYEQAITHRTKAVIVVHYAGVSAEMSRILEISRKNNIAIVEDNAHGLGGFFEDRPLGSMGTFSTQSFHETKNLQCGEGGSIGVNDVSHIELIEILREKGTNRSNFFRGAVDKYTWVGKGSSWIQSDILAALLLGQIDDFELIQNRREKIWNTYADELKIWAETNEIRIPFIPSYAKHTAHIFYMIFKSKDDRDSMQDFLRSKEINAPFHYQPLHSSLAGKKYGKQSGTFSGTEVAGNQLLRLPIWYELSESQLSYIIEAVTSQRFN